VCLFSFAAIPIPFLKPLLSSFLRSLLQVLNQFGPLSSDIAEAQRYAAWKAADIRKALREGRTPLPGPPATWGSGGGGNGGGVAGPADAMPTLSTPPTGPPGLDRSDSALGTGPGGDLLITLAPPRFAPGDAVFYCPDGHGPPTRGVVTGGPFPPEGLGHTYTLALATGGGDGVDATGTSPGQAVRAFEVQLAPDVGAGAAARLGPPPPPPPPGPEGSSSPPPKDVPPAGACVVEALVDPSAWRPAYRVKMEGAKKAVVVSDTRLAGWPRGGPGAGGGVPPPATSSSPPPPFAAPHAPPAAAAATPSAPPIPPPSSSTTAPPAVPSLAVLAEAQKAARSAASSIAFEDVGTAVRFLQEALRLLTVDGASVSNSKKK